MYTVTSAEGVAGDFGRVPANQRARILERIELPWDHVAPVWELRIGEYRVFYDVDEAESTVIIRALRQKPPHQTTKEIL